MWLSSHRQAYGFSPLIYNNVILSFYIVRCPFSFCYSSVILFPVTDTSAYQHRIFGLYPSVPVHLTVLTGVHPSLPPSSFFYNYQLPVPIRFSQNKKALSFQTMHLKRCNLLFCRFYSFAS